MKWLYLLIGLALGALAHFLYSGAASNSAAVRTDLTVYRDAETGCEYLKPAWSFSGLTPRNDSLGVPICKDEGIDERVEKMLDDIGDGGNAPTMPGNTTPPSAEPAPAQETSPPQNPDAAPPEGNAPAPSTPPPATPGPGAAPPTP
jgi:hypothetical protein